MAKKRTNEENTAVDVKNATTEVFEEDKRTVEETIAEYTLMYHKSERNSEKAILRVRIEELEKQLSK